MKKKIFFTVDNSRDETRFCRFTRKIKRKQELLSLPIGTDKLPYKALQSRLCLSEMHCKVGGLPVG